MSDNAWITTAGEAKIVNALATTTPFNITKWKVADTPNVTLDQSLTDVVGTVVDNGTVAEMEFDIISADNILIRVILDESKGPYDVGNVGLFSDDDTLIAIGTFEIERPKTPNAIGVVGNRFVITIPINFVDVQSSINFTVFTGVFSSWPFVQTIADLPDPNISPFEGYIVREDPSQNRPITAIRNEDPPTSGTFVWTFDYHNRIAGDSQADDNVIEIDTTTGIQSYKISGNTEMLLDTTGLGIGTSSPQRPLHIEKATPGIRLTDTDTNAYDEIFHAASGLLNFSVDVTGVEANSGYSFSVDGSEAFRITDRVGVFTSTPNETLTINGSLGFGDTSTLGRVDFISASNSLILEADPGVSASSSSIRFNVDNSEVVRFASDGKVGIGESVPTHQLHVKTGDSGGTAAFSLTPNLMIEDDNLAGIQFATSNSGSSRLVFGSPADNNAFDMSYSVFSDTFSLSFDGTGDYLITPDQFRFNISGTEANPAVAIGTDTTGIYLPNINELGFVIAGTERMRLDGTSLSLLNNTAFTFSNGTAAAPSIAFTDNPDTGIFSDVGPFAAGISFSLGGEEVGGFRGSTNPLFNGDFALGVSPDSLGTKLDAQIAYLYNDSPACYLTFLNSQSNLSNVTTQGIRFGVESNGVAIWDNTYAAGLTSIKAANAFELLILTSLRFALNSTTMDFRSHDFRFGHETRRGTFGLAMQDNINSGPANLTVLDINPNNDWYAGRLNGNDVILDADSAVYINSSGFISVSSPTTTFTGTLNTPSINITNVWGPVQITGFVNAFDGPVDYTAPAGSVFVGEVSEHDNGSEDRRFRFRYRQLNLGGTP